MNAKLDASRTVSGYSEAFRLLRQLPGFDQRKTLRGEMAIILKAWAGRTKVSTVKEATARARYRAGKRAFGLLKIDRNPFSISVNTGVRGGFPGEVWFRTRNKRFQQAGTINNSGNFTASNTHWRAADWTKIKEGAELYGSSLKRELGIAPKTVGLARQSVVQIADALNIDLTAVQGQGISAAGINKARAAIASNGRTYVNGTGSEEGDEQRAAILAVCRLPYAQKAGMDRVLASVISGRTKYIEKSYEAGAFDSIQRATRAFPNILAAKF